MEAVVNKQQQAKQDDEELLLDLEEQNQQPSLAVCLNDASEITTAAGLSFGDNDNENVL